MIPVAEPDPTAPKRTPRGLSSDEWLWLIGWIEENYHGQSIEQLRTEFREAIREGKVSWLDWDWVPSRGAFVEAIRCAGPRSTARSTPESVV